MKTQGRPGKKVILVRWWTQIRRLQHAGNPGWGRVGEQPCGAPAREGEREGRKAAPLPARTSAGTVTWFHVPPCAPGKAPGKNLRSPWGQLAVGPSCQAPTTSQKAASSWLPRAKRRRQQPQRPDTLNLQERSREVVEKKGPLGRNELQRIRFSARPSQFPEAQKQILMNPGSEHQSSEKGQYVP